MTSVGAQRKATAGRLSIAAVAVTLVAIVSGHPAIAEVVSGLLLLGITAWAGTTLARRATLERDPGRELILDLGLVAVVLLGLAGVTIISLAIPGLN